MKTKFDFSNSLSNRDLLPLRFVSKEETSWPTVFENQRRQNWIKFPSFALIFKAVLSFSWIQFLSKRFSIFPIFRMPCRFFCRIVSNFDYSEFRPNLNFVRKEGCCGLRGSEQWKLTTISNSRYLKTPNFKIFHPIPFSWNLGLYSSERSGGKRLLRR